MHILSDKYPKEDDCTVFENKCGEMGRSSTCCLISSSSVNKCLFEEPCGKDQEK